MRFKDRLLQLFKLAGSQAYPHDSSREVDISSGTFIATDDGYLLIGAKSGSGVEAFVNSWGRITMSCYGSDKADARIAIPCAKGQTVYCSYQGPCDISRFVPSKGSC